MKTIAMICILVLAPAMSLAETTGRRDVSTSVSLWFVDEYGPIFQGYYINDRYTPDDLAAAGLGEPVFTEYVTQDQRTDTFRYKGNIVIVYYYHGYSRTILAIHSALLMVEDQWVLRPR